MAFCYLNTLFHFPEKLNAWKVFHLATFYCWQKYCQCLIPQNDANVRDTTLSLCFSWSIMKTELAWSSSLEHGLYMGSFFVCPAWQRASDHQVGAILLTTPTVYAQPACLNYLSSHCYIRMGENNSRWSNWQTTNLKNIQATPTAQLQKKKSDFKFLGVCILKLRLGIWVNYFYYKHSFTH